MKMKRKKANENLGLFSFEMRMHKSLLRILIALCMSAWVSFSVLATPPGKVQHLIDKAYEIRSSDPDGFQSVMNELEAIRGDATNEQKDSIAYLWVYNATFRGEYDKALRLARELQESTKSKEMNIRVGALVANTYAFQRNYPEGLRELERIVPEITADIPAELRHQVWGVASVLYSQVGQDQLALDSAEKVLIERPSGRTLCLANNAKYEALFNLKRLPKDASEIESAISQCVSINELTGSNGLRLFLAYRYLDDGELDKATSLLADNLEQVESLGFTFLTLRVKALLAELYRRQGDASRAETFATEVIQLAGPTPRSRPVVDAYYTLYLIAQERRDLEQALVYYRRYAEARQDYLNDVFAREAAYQMVRQENLQREQLVKELNGKNELLQLQREVEQKSAQNSRLIIVLLILLLGGVGLWAVRTRRVHRKLREMAEVDALTGVCNRHHFTNQAERSLAMCAGAGEEVALVMFDLDHFKAVNDQYGHAVGDWVLKHVATTSRTFCRRVDTLGRIGGEEFAFLLHGCDLQTATRLAEDCRARIALIDTIESGYKYTITASFGAASSKVSGYQLTRLLSHADKMLYRAKSLGRNRVCAYDGNTEFEMPAEPLPRTGTVTHISSAHPEAANRSHHSAV